MKGGKGVEVGLDERRADRTVSFMGQVCESRVGWAAQAPTSRPGRAPRSSRPGPGMRPARRRKSRLDGAMGSRVRQALQEAHHACHRRGGPSHGGGHGRQRLRLNFPGPGEAPAPTGPRCAEDPSGEKA